MTSKIIPLSQLQEDLVAFLSECADTGEPLVVELPDHRLVAIQPLDPTTDDSLLEELLASNPRFQELVARSKASPRKPFLPESPA